MEFSSLDFEVCLTALEEIPPEAMKSLCIEVKDLVSRVTVGPMQVCYSGESMG
jgi:hypothetical protein